MPEDQDLQKAMDEIEINQAIDSELPRNAFLRWANAYTEMYDEMVRSGKYTKEQFRTYILTALDLGEEMIDKSRDDEDKQPKIIV